MLFWHAVPLEQLSREQWEALCDRCGKCCLHKLQDEDDDVVYYTDVACRCLDTSTAQCTNYGDRFSEVPGCLHLTPQTLAECHWWLPPSCAYRRLAEGKDLASWHPLRSGRWESVAEYGHSVRRRVVLETEVNEDLWQERVVHWVTDDE